MQAFTEKVEIWRDSIAAFAAAIRKLSIELNTHPDVDDETPQFPNIVLLCDFLEEKLARLEAKAKIVANPETIKKALSRSSHTYSDQIRRAAKLVTETGKAARGLFNDVLQSSSFVEAGAEKIGVRSIATEIYMGSLACKPAEVAMPALDRAISELFDVPVDSAASAEFDAAQMAKYHILQRMLYTPFFVRAETVDALPVDISLPRAKVAIKYNLTNLIDRQAALKFGPISTTVSGINFKVIERLRTITATPKEIEKTQPPAAIYTSPVAMTEGAGAVLFGEPTVQIWAPFSGAKPYSHKYHCAVSDVIMPRTRDEFARWGNVRRNYEQSMRDAPPKSDADILAKYIYSAFESAFDASPPKHEREYFRLITGDITRPSSYLTIGYSKMMNAKFDEQMQAILIRSGDPGLVPHPVRVREGRVSCAIDILTGASKLLQRVRQLYNLYEWSDSDAATKQSARKLLFKACSDVDPTPITLKQYAANSRVIMLEI